MFQTVVTGIDISPKSIKIVSIKYSKNRLKLVRYKKFTSHSYILDDNHTLNYQESVNKLKKVKKELPFFSHNVAISVPDSSVVSRFLHIDKSIREEEREFAIYEAFSTSSPIPPNELRIDFVPDEKVNQIEESSVGYQVYAARKEIVDKRISATKDAGLSTVLVDTQSHSLLKIWQLSSELNDCRNWLLLNVDTHQTILCSGQPSQSPFHKTIQVTLYAEEDAESVNKLVSSIAVQIQLYSSANPDTNVEGVWLMGDSNSLVKVGEALEKHVNIRCMLLNPLVLIETEEDISPENEPCSYSLALGIALKAASWSITHDS